jgi:hypothetical protein
MAAITHFRRDGTVDITVDGVLTTIDIAGMSAVDRDAAILAVTGPPPRVIPESVSRSQAKVALEQAGLLATVEAFMDGPDISTTAKIFWAEEPRFERDSNLINTLGAALGLTSTQIDDLFVAAAGINP